MEEGTGGRVQFRGRKGGRERWKRRGEEERAEVERDPERFSRELE